MNAVSTAVGSSRHGIHAVARLASKGQRSSRTEAELRLANGRLAATSITVHAVPHSGTFGTALIEREVRDSVIEAAVV